MGRPSKFGEKTQAIRVPLSKLDQVMKLLDDNDDDDSGLFVRNQSGDRVEIPDYAVEPVLRLVDALKFLHEYGNAAAAWSIRFGLETLWNRLLLYRAESSKLRLMGRLPDGAVCQVVGYRSSLSEFGELSSGVDVKTQTGVYHYGLHRVELFVDEGGQ